MKKEVYEKCRQRALEFYEKAHIVLTQQEKDNLEVADFGLNDVDATGLEIITYVNTEKCCAKEMVLFPHQTCPEHRHKPLGDYPGKEETFRVRYGTVYLYVEGDPVAAPAVQPPAGSKEFYTVWHEIVLHPGEQYAGAALPLLERFQNIGSRRVVKVLWSLNSVPRAMMSTIFLPTRISREFQK